MNIQMFTENLFSPFYFENFEIYRKVAKIARETPIGPLSGFLNVKLLLNLFLVCVCVCVCVHEYTLDHLRITCRYHNTSSLNANLLRMKAFSYVIIQLCHSGNITVIRCHFLIHVHFQICPSIPITSLVFLVYFSSLGYNLGSHVSCLFNLL